MKRFVSLMLISGAAALALAETPSDYAAQLGIEAPANAALLRLPLNAEVYRALRRPDLGDLRVFNAAGEALPMARIAADLSEHTLTRRVALTALPATATPPPGTSVGAGSTQVLVNQRGGDTQVRVDLGRRMGTSSAILPARFVADTDAFKRVVHAIEIPLPSDTAFEGRVQVETSRDLAEWRTLAASEAVLAVGGGDARFTRTRIEIKGLNARYLRLTWLGAPPSPAPGEIELIHRENGAPPPHQWLDLSGKPSGAVGRASIDYLSPGLFPVDQLRLVPAQSGNDVMVAQVDSRASVSARWQVRAGRAVGYRLEESGAVKESPAVSFAKTRDPLWQVTSIRPETTALAPVLRLGWLPEEIVFVARGAGPYLLAAGHPDRAPAWLPVETVVPGYRSAAAAVPTAARLMASATAVAPVARAQSVLQPGKHWWLWAALLLGVAVLGGMARGLWRDLQGPRPQQPRA